MDSKRKSKEKKMEWKNARMEERTNEYDEREEMEKCM